MSFQDFLSKLGPLSWSLHNLIAHPVSELVYLLGAKRLSAWIHDVTIPTHEPEEGRG